MVKRRRRQITNEEQSFFCIDKLNVARSDIPAVTHVENYRGPEGPQCCAIEGMFAAANPGAALERERLHRLEEKIEKCCPLPKPTPPCTFIQCPAPTPIGPPPRVAGR